MKKQKKYNIIDIIMIIALIFLNIGDTRNEIKNNNYIYLLILGFVICYFSVFMSNAKSLGLKYFIPILTLGIFDMFFLENTSFFNNNEILKDIFHHLNSLYSFLLLMALFFIISKISNKLIGSYFTIAISIICLILTLSIDLFKKPEILINYSFYIRMFFLYSLFFNLRMDKKDKSKYLIGLILAICLLVLEIFIAKRYFIFDKTRTVSDILIYYFLFKLFISDIIEIDFSKYYISAILFQLPIITKILDYYLKLNEIRNYIASFIILLFLAIIFYQIKFFIFDYILYGIHKNKK
ncbi:MAG: hypothetical protein Q4B52_00430 [Tissierellia bacterium]|nr:hypothetical protein [Tissierellia bacterium]